jgi:hypothetical protein
VLLEPVPVEALTLLQLFKLLLTMIQAVEESERGSFFKCCALLI